MKLYRLKSNPKTIVKKDGIHHKVVWTERMEQNLGDSSWMMARWNADNVVELSKEETKTVNQKIKNFKST